MGLWAAEMTTSMLTARTTARESDNDNREELEGTHRLLLLDTTCNDSHVNVWLQKFGCTTSRAFLNADLTRSCQILDNEYPMTVTKMEEV